MAKKGTNTEEKAQVEAWPKTYYLNTAERFMLAGVLPQETNFATLKIVRQLKDELTFSEEEHKQLNLRVEGMQWAWDPKKDFDKRIQVGEKAYDIIAGALKELDKNNKLTENHFRIYEKFMS